MPSHWTYEPFEPSDDLRQGDILEVSPGLIDLFGKYHKHFCDPKYIGYIVLTQSCDLVRRKGCCSARYVSLAVVRQLEEVLDNLLETVCKKVIPGVYCAETKAKANELLARILNQNEQALGLFYLHPDADAGIAVASVALLRVSVAFRTEHYAALLEARRGRMTAEFRNKLGWLVGNLYSRIGTTDWHEQEGEKRLKEMIRQLLDPQCSGQAPLWIPEPQITEALHHQVNLDTLTKDTIEDALQAHKPKVPADIAAERVIEVVRDVVWPATSSPSGPVVSANDPERVDPEILLTQIANRLRNDHTFRETFRR